MNDFYCLLKNILKLGRSTGLFQLSCGPINLFCLYSIPWIYKFMFKKNIKIVRKRIIELYSGNLSIYNWLMGGFIFMIFGDSYAVWSCWTVQQCNHHGDSICTSHQFFSVAKGMNFFQAKGKICKRLKTVRWIQSEDNKQTKA